MKAGQGEDGSVNAEEEGPRRASAVVTDPRFQSVHSDPRFQRVPKRHSKVTVDARFAGMFSDERFGSSAAPVDKRGKPRQGKRENPLLRYYIGQDTEEGDAPEDGGADDIEKSRLLNALKQRSKSEDEESSSGSSDDSSTTSSSDEEDEDEDDQYSIGSDVAHYLMASHDDTPQTEQATHRLAAVNMDWDHIKAVDLYAVMTSCLPKDGHISSVAVYPSEFGLKCMEIEATQGPSALIRGKDIQLDEDGDGSSSVGNTSDEENEDDSDSADDEQENEKLRNYELNRLRYFYAVVDCDSSTTADHLYKTLDGSEVLRTSNVLDLRFIPDSMEFHHPPRDIATEIPGDYKEPDFHTRALQHSNVKLTWEEEEPQRKKLLKRKFNADQLDEMEFKEFLASSSSDDDVEENEEIGGLHDGQRKKLKKGEKYLALLQSADDGSGSDDKDEEVEITFNTGLEDVAKRALEKRDKKSETVWEAYLRKRKEKKMARKKQRGKYSSEDDDDSIYDQEARDTMDQSDDFFEESDSDTKAEKKRRKGSTKVSSKKDKKDKKQRQELDKEEEATQAELELLCATRDQPESPHRDDDGKVSGKVKKKGKKPVTEDKLPKEDYHADPRFAAMLTSHHFALDPTDPQYKRSATYARQILQKQKFGNAQDAVIQVEKGKLQAPEAGNGESDGAKSNEMLLEKHRALALARSLKRKTETLKAERKNR